MDIAYVQHSKFLEACEVALASHRPAMEAGRPVNVSFVGGGYGGQITVTIRPHDQRCFGTNWENVDPTRFPARIKAAATALARCHFEGRFEISHSDGIITIRAI